MLKYISLIIILLFVFPYEARAQGAVYSPGNVISLSSTFPGSCSDGNVIILSVAIGNFAKGTMHACLANAWTPVVPTALVVSGTTLPATCLVGALFTITPTGALWTCPQTNTFVPVAATIVPAKTITGLANNVFANILTFTIPNSASGALIEVSLTGSLGAGGAIGQYEATTGKQILVAITRTPGLSTDATHFLTNNALDARVVGAGTIAFTTQLSAISGLNSATQTFTLQARITRGAGSSDNHIVSVATRLISPLLTNITVQ